MKYSHTEQKKIFLSYVRVDSEADTGRLVDTLKQEFPDVNLFIDVEDIELGANWKRVVERAIEGSLIVLCAIGPNWTLSSAIKHELAIALQFNIPVVPILFRQANFMALTDGLEAETVGFRDRNAISIEHKTWHRDIEPLKALIREVVTDPSRARVIIDTPNPESLLEFNPSSSHNITTLLNYIQDLAECLADDDLYTKARKAAINFSAELDKKREYDSEMKRAGSFYRNIKAPEPNLVQITIAAKKRLEIEMEIRELIKRLWTPVQFQKVARYLDDESILARLTYLREEYIEAVKDYRDGGMSSPAEAKKELDEATNIVRDRLRAELPGITKRYPDRKWS